MTNPTDQEGAVAKAGLFEDIPQPSVEQQAQHARVLLAERRSQGAARLLKPNRQQVELRASDLESLLSPDHRARLVWGYVVRQDLSGLVEAVKARGSNAGRAAIDPAHPVCAVAVRHARRRGQRARGDAAVPGARCVPLDVRWRVGELPRDQRLSLG